MQIIKGVGIILIKELSLSSRFSIWEGGRYREIIEKGRVADSTFIPHTSRGSPKLREWWGWPG